MYELTPLFLYKLQFMAELIIAEIIMFCYCKRKDKFILRAILSVLACFAFAFAFPIAAYNMMYSIIMFFALAGFTVLMLKVCYDEKIFTIVFIVVSAYAIQHIAHQAYEFLLTVTGANGNVPSNSYGSDEFTFVFNPFDLMIYIVTYIATYCVGFALVSNKYIKNFKKLKIKQVSLFIIAACIILFAIILSLYMTYLSYDDYNKSYIVVVFIYDIFSCILALFIQYEVALRERLEIDYNTMSHLYHQEQEHFELMKKNVDLINLKCHDLKHQIRAIGQQSLVSKDTIKEMEQVIKIYDAAIKTGNDALDIILTEKSLHCNENDITLSCMIDGKMLGFMNDSDIYSLFGNLVDNAIEAVSKLPKENRTISMYVKNIKRILTINVHNYYETKVIIKGDTIITSKDDKDYHGFGIKSIKHVCEKYNGSITMNAEDNIFRTSIAITIPKQD